MDVSNQRSVTSYVSNLSKSRTYEVPLWLIAIPAGEYVVVAPKGTLNTFLFYFIFIFIFIFIFDTRKGEPFTAAT